jgi:hypothetical protein
MKKTQVIEKRFWPLRWNIIQNRGLMARRDQMPDRASARGLAGSTTGSIGERLEQTVLHVLPRCPSSPVTSARAGLFDRAGALSQNDYSAPAAYGFRDVLVKGFVDEVVEHFSGYPAT